MASRNAQKYTVQIQVAKICHLYIWHLQEKDEFYWAIDHWDGCVVLTRQKGKLFKCSSGPHIWLFPNIVLYIYVIYIYLFHLVSFWDQQRWETWMKKIVLRQKSNCDQTCVAFFPPICKEETPWNSPKNGDDRVLHHVTAGTWADGKAHVAHDTGLIWEESLGEASGAWF